MWSLVLVLVGLSTFAHANLLLRRIEGVVTAALLVFVTVTMTVAIVRMVWLVLARGSMIHGLLLLSTGVSMWLTNMVIFALWYWLLDRGGPERRLRNEPGAMELLFPEGGAQSSSAGWMPQFLDYVYVAFNVSVAFNANETLALSPRVKVLMMTHALLSFVTVLIVVARAVNILD